MGTELLLDGEFPPEPDYPDFEPEYLDDFSVKETWDGDPDEPKTPETEGFELTDSDDEGPRAQLGRQHFRENQAQRWLGQKIWGFVIYRCTYTDDVKWKQFMEIFQSMGRCHTVTDAKLNASLTFDVREDKSLFESADVSTLRAHFEDWIHSDTIRSEIQEKDLEKHESDDDAALLHRIHSIQINQLEPAYLRAPRYVYFIYIDEMAMESVLAEKNWTPATYCGWVNVVNTDLPVGGAVFAAGQDRDISVRKITPNRLYPEYYKLIASPSYWDTRPEYPLVDIGDM